MSDNLTDTERLDFLDRQGFTRWVGYGTSTNHTTWPVFAGGNLREQIDIAIRESSREDSENASGQ